MNLATLLILISWGLAFVIIGLGLVTGYEVFPLVITVSGLSLLFRAFGVKCRADKCRDRGFLLLWSVFLLESGPLIELYKYYPSPALIIGIFLIVLAVSAYIIDKKYSII
ncbi:MAG: hypothetical protein ACP5II_01015 [Infirmifilum sp.]|uniref:hypothetical protein n=1 Tax=Infirmifilum TaxID=2856573 RepID=UPI00235319F6